MARSTKRTPGGRWPTIPWRRLQLTAKARTSRSGRAARPDTGWGLVGETWRAMDALGRYGGQTWFRLGDADLATHLYRTQRRREGAALSQVTAELAAAWGVGVGLLPATDDRVATRLTLAEDGQEIA